MDAGGDPGRGCGRLEAEERDGTAAVVGYVDVVVVLVDGDARWAGAGGNHRWDLVAAGDVAVALQVAPSMIDTASSK